MGEIKDKPLVSGEGVTKYQPLFKIRDDSPDVPASRFAVGCTSGCTTLIPPGGENDELRLILTISLPVCLLAIQIVFFLHVE